MNNIFTICYSEEEANEIGHFILSRGYEGVQMIAIDIAVKRFGGLSQAKRHHLNCIYVGVAGCQMTVSKSKRGLRRNCLKYIEKRRMFYKLLSKY